MDGTMGSEPTASFLNKFTNTFNHTEKSDSQIVTNDMPALSFSGSLSVKDTAFGSVIMPGNTECDSDLVDKDLKAMNLSKTSETKMHMEADVPLTNTGQPRDQSKSNNDLRTQEQACQNENSLLDVCMDLGNDSSTVCQTGEVADGKADMLSTAFMLESDNSSFRMPSYGLVFKAEDNVTSDKNASELTGNTTVASSGCIPNKGVLVQKESACQEKTNELEQSKTTVAARISFQVSSADISASECTYKTSMDEGHHVIYSGPDRLESDWQDKYVDGHLSTTLQNTDFITDLYERRDFKDIFPKAESDQLFKLESTSPEDLSEPQEQREMKEAIQETRELQMEKNDVNYGTVMKDESTKLGQKEGQAEKIVQVDNNTEFLDVHSNPGNLSNYNHSKDSATTEDIPGPSTPSKLFSSGLKLDRPHQIPTIFSGIKWIQKEANEQPKEPVSPEQHKGSDPIKLKCTKRVLFSEQQSKSEVRGSILEQISQLLSFDTSKVGTRKDKESTSSPPLSPALEKLTDENEEKTGLASSEKNSKSTTTETAFDAFRAFFTPKPVKRDTSDHIDRDSVKRAFNPEAIRAIFDKTSSKNTSDLKTPGSEERSPGRLHAIWPPPKPKDAEEKIGLKYTEAEHQAALIQLKRECKEELEVLEADFKLQLFRLREENEESLSRQNATIVTLKQQIQSLRVDLRDAAVSTDLTFTPCIVQTVAIQTDQETLIHPVENPELNTGICQLVPSKKLNIASFFLGISSNKDPVPKQEQIHSQVQTQLPPAPPAPPPPAPLPGFSVKSEIICSAPSPLVSGPSDVSICLNHAQSMDEHLQLKQGNSLPIPPPPPPPPPTVAGHSSPLFLPGSLPSPPDGVESFLGCDERTQRKPRVEPACPMKPLHWTRIQIHGNRNDTLWSSLKEPVIINSNEFAEMFAKTVSPTKRKPLSEAYNKTVKVKKIIKILDGKRSQAVGILISSLHLEMKDIQQAVLKLDNSVVDIDAIEALYENRAQPEELERIRKHYETSDEEHVKLLDKPEQFLYELSQIPQFSLRVRCIILQSTFSDAIASIKCKTEIVLHVCQGLLERDSVREVLGLVLALGNYMNGGNRTRGQADGFNLEILPKLKDVKSRDNRLSLLDFVVSYYLHNLDANAGTESCVFPLPEPQDVLLASQVKFEDLFKDLRKLGKDLEGHNKDVQRVCSTSAEQYLHPFKEKMQDFISEAQQEQIQTERKLIYAQKSFSDLVQYFGMGTRSGEKVIQPDQVFMLWFEFCNDFKTRWKRENKAISKERLKEAQRSVRNITADKKVETRQVHANSLKERLRLKEASLSST